MHRDIIVIGDIHNAWYQAEDICNKYPDTLKIFVGDYFDSIEDNAGIAADTAMWLKNSLKSSDRIHLLGNHDFQYLSQGKHICSGFSVEKNNAINSILSLEDWQSIKLYTNIDKWLISHAGFTHKWFEHPVIGFNLDNINNIIDRAYRSIHTQTSDILPLWAADHWRGGRYNKGGLLWNDWRNSDFISGYNQIFGHTHVDHIKYIIGRRKKVKSININIDCGLTEYLLLTTDNKILVKGKNEREIPNI